MSNYAERGGPPQTLGQLAQASRSRSGEERSRRYALLLQTERNQERAKKHRAILEDRVFRDCCEVAGVKPSRRQASKWRRKFGAAYTQQHHKAA
jgi:hypothetical protein